MLRHTWQGSPLSGVTLICPYCGATHTPLSLGSAHQTAKKNEGLSGFTIVSNTRVLACTACHMPYFQVVAENRTIPGQRLGAAIKNLPPEVDALYSEARSAASAGAYTACAMVARKILMNLAVIEGAKENQNFQTYVDYLASNGFVPPRGKPWVDKIRTTGNAATHEIELVTPQGAADVMHLVENLLRFNFEMAGP